MKQVFSKSQIETIIAAFDIYATAYCNTLPTDEELKNIAFSKRFEKRMQKLINRQSKFYYKLINTAAKRVACYIAIVMIVTFATTFSVEALRVPFIDFIMKYHKTHIELIFNDAPETIMKFQPILPEYIPAGFEVENYQSDRCSIFYKYDDGNSNEIYYLQEIKTQDRNNIDNEHSTYEKIYLKDGKEALLGHHMGTDVSITFANDLYVFKLHSNLPLEEVIKIAESIDY